MSKDINKNNALAALLDSNTFTEAAQKAGISRKTLYNYMRDDLEFATAYKAALDRLTLERFETVAADRQRAKNAIFAIMDDEKQPGAVRLKAAQSILDAATDATTQANKIAARNLEENENPMNFINF